MNMYKKLHGEELLLKIRGFGKLDSENKISKAIFQCGYYHKNLSNEIVLEPKEDITGLECMGKQVTDKLELVAAKLFIKRYIRPKYIQNSEDGLS